MLCDAAVGFRKMTFRRAAPRILGRHPLMGVEKEMKRWIKRENCTWKAEISLAKPRWKLQSQPRFPDYLLLFSPVALTSALRRIKIKPRFRNNGETFPMVFFRGTGSSSGHEKSRGHNNKMPIEYHAPIHIAWIGADDSPSDPFERKREGRNS